VSVPVAWIDPAPGDLACVQQGAEIMVVGTVRRRFFRVGGATQSRTEVVAAEVVAATDRRRARRLLERLGESLGVDAGGALRSG
jgi:single-strand DNA-binding protein